MLSKMLKQRKLTILATQQAGDRAMKLVVYGEVV
jgi:hypothetical protein